MKYFVSKKIPKTQKKSLGPSSKLNILLIHWQKTIKIQHLCWNMWL